SRSRSQRRSSRPRRCAAPRRRRAGRSSRPATSGTHRRTWRRTGCSTPAPSHDPRSSAPSSCSVRSEEHTSELQSPYDLVCRLLPPIADLHPLSLHDALPICREADRSVARAGRGDVPRRGGGGQDARHDLQQAVLTAVRGGAPAARHRRRPTTRALQRQVRARLDRKSTRLNSSHRTISYAVFCLPSPISTLFPYTTLFRSVEKPIAASLEQAAAMCRAAEAAGRTLVTTCNKRYSPPYVEAHRLLDTGAVPRPALFSAKFVLG